MLYLKKFCHKNDVINNFATKILSINSKCVLMIQQQSEIIFKYHQ